MLQFKSSVTFLDFKQLTTNITHGGTISHNVAFSQVIPKRLTTCSSETITNTKTAFLKVERSWKTLYSFPRLMTLLVDLLHVVLHWNQRTQRLVALFRYFTSSSGRRTKNLSRTFKQPPPALFKPVWELLDVLYIELWQKISSLLSLYQQNN